MFKILLFDHPLQLRLQVVKIQEPSLFGELETCPMKKTFTQSRPLQTVKKSL